MISENSLKRMCSAAVMGRARRVADRGLRLHARKCHYDGPDTVLSAKVDASYEWDGPYRTSIVLDENADAMVDYDCDCPAAHRFVGPCKHSVALALDFNARPELYEGYEKGGRLYTSRSMARLLDRVSTVVPSSSGPSTEPSAGTVRLEPTLSYGSNFSVRFRIVGAQGAYVLKSIYAFVVDVENGAYQSYGKKLSFTHTLDAFTPQTQDVVRFLMRAVANRRSYLFNQAMRFGSTGSTAPKRELDLSLPEALEFIGFFVGQNLYFEDIGTQSWGAKVRDLQVVEEDPDVAFEVVPYKEQAFELRVSSYLQIVDANTQAVAWDKEKLYLCGPALSKQAGLLEELLDSDGELIIAERDLTRFCATVLPSIEGVAQVQAPDELDSYRPIPCELVFRLDRTRLGAVCEAEAVYGEVRLPLLGTGAAPSMQMLSKAMHENLVRDQAMEVRGRETLKRYFNLGESGELVVPSSNRDALARLVFEGVGELQSLGTVFVTPSFERLRSTARPQVRVGVSVHSNLLDLSLQVEGLPNSELSALLASYRLKRQYHRLRDGSFVDMRGLDLSEANGVAEELGLTAQQLAAGRVSMPAYKVFLLNAMVADEDKDESVYDYIDKIRGVNLASFEVPAELASVLRPYQVEGYRWLCGLAQLGLGGILADEMGLGKSVQLIAFLLAHKLSGEASGPSLIVCPASLVYNWLAEFNKFAPALEVRVVAGTAAERRSMRMERNVDVLVTSYDLLRRDVEDYAAMSFYCVALDEAQYIKNHATLAAQAVKVLRSEHALALTGTPVENRLSELWSIFDFLMPGLLGSYERFRDRYERPIVEGQDMQLADRLRGAVRPFILRRVKRDVVKDLPEKIEQVVFAHMDKPQRSLYNAQVQELRERVENQGEQSFGRSKLQVLAALTRLRQLCCDPQLVYEGYDKGACKVDTIMTLVERVTDAGEKMLIFSQFTSFLDVIAGELRELDIPFYTITGATSKRRRMDLVDKFNADATPVFLISLKAGGTGLNLTGASVVVHADPWWNAAAQNQATDRAHRIGQTHDVTVYKVIARNTIEERILDLQRTKSELADAVVEGDASGLSLSQLTRDDLEELLG
ncbi:MAG: DEAD/DEAH box helicase [Coriobacteriales bacterium]|nr:DEAD/DEAH box helicase [Coriobacteriales bacterium]